MIRLIFKTYFYIRRKISSRFFFYFEKVLVAIHKIELTKPNFSNKVNFFFPVEIQLNQNILNRKVEINELERAYSKKELPDLIRSTINLERNKAYRWNAFYPLYSLLGNKQDIQPFECKHPKKVAISYITYWIDFFLIQGCANPFCWYDMADSFRLIFFYKILEEESDKLNKIEISKIQYAINIHEFFLTKDSVLQKGNHRIFQLLARLCIYSLRDNKMSLGSEIEELTTFFNTQFSEEGFHVEHSPEYHLWANFIFSTIFNNYIPVGHNIAQKIERIAEKSDLFFTPDGKIPLIGDSGYDNVESYKSLFNQNKLKQNLISKDYLISVDRCKGWYLISLLAGNSMTHKHNDSCSFELFMMGSKIITDSGKYSYSKSELSKVVRTETNHNVAFIENDQSRYSTQTYSLIDRFTKYGLNIISLRSKVRGQSHTRKFIYNSINHLTMVDTFDSSEEKICEYLNLIRADTYNVKLENEYKTEYFSKEMNTRISFLNVNDHGFKKTYLSEFYGKIEEKKAIKVSSQKMIITSITYGSDSQAQRRDNNYIVKVGKSSINIDLNGKVDIFK